MLIATGAAVVLVIALIVVQQVTKDDSNGPDPSNLTGLAEVQAEFDGLTETAGTIGPSSATVTITEYGDLRCPVCRSFDNEVVPSLVEDLVAHRPRPSCASRAWPILGPNSVPRLRRRPMRRAEQNALWRYAALTYLNQGDETRELVHPSFRPLPSPRRWGSTWRASTRIARARPPPPRSTQVNREATEARVAGHPVDPREPGRRGSETVNASYEAIAAGVQKVGGAAG